MNRKEKKQKKKPKKKQTPTPMNSKTKSRLKKKKRHQTCNLSFVARCVLKLKCIKIYTLLQFYKNNLKLAFYKH